MKTLVHNYSSEISTEALYIAKYLQGAGHEVRVWGNKESAFDVFDDSTPEVFFTHYLMLTHDIVKRMAGEDIKLVVNVTGATNQHIQMIDQIQNDIYCFQNYGILEDIPVISPCADFYLSEQKAKTPNYAIETLFVIDSESDLKKLTPLFFGVETFHVLSLSQDLVKLKEVDAYVPIAPLASLYQNYENVVVAKPSQVFYDAAYQAGASQLVQDEKTSLFLKKEVVESSHSPYNRVTALLEMIGENKPDGENDARYIGYSGNERV